MQNSNGGRPHQWPTNGGGDRAYLRLPGSDAPRADSGNADLYITPIGQDAIVRAYQAGLGVMVSKTSDGGALSLTVYDGETRYREYAGNGDEADRVWDLLDELTKARSTPPQLGGSQSTQGMLKPRNGEGSKPTRKLRGAR